MVSNAIIRASPEFRKIINKIKAKYLLENKKPPTTSKITAIIANKIKKEDVLNDLFIRF